MGLHMVERLIEKGHSVTAYDLDEKSRKRAHQIGAQTTSSLEELMEQASTPRTIWLMVPHQAVDTVLTELTKHLKEGDTVIEGGNSPFEKTIERAKNFEEHGIHFLDAGVSGGPSGARNGACIMVGGKKETFQMYEVLFKDLTIDEGYTYVGESGSGHFVKMVHNGIEYGMMQSLAEGFDVLRNAQFSQKLPLTNIAKLYSKGSVIESRLVGWLADGFTSYGEDLDDISGSASASGEGLWTIETAKKIGVPTVVIEDSVQARTESQKKPSYQGKLISVMRNQFGGHDVKNTHHD